MITDGSALAGYYPDQRCLWYVGGSDPDALFVEVRLLPCAVFASAVDLPVDSFVRTFVLVRACVPACAWWLALAACVRACVLHCRCLADSLAATAALQPDASSQLSSLSLLCAQLKWTSFSIVAAEDIVSVFGTQAQLRRLCRVLDSSAVSPRWPAVSGLLALSRLRRSFWLMLLFSRLLWCSLCPRADSDQADDAKLLASFTGNINLGTNRCSCDALPACLLGLPLSPLCLCCSSAGSLACAASARCPLRSSVQIPPPSSFCFFFETTAEQVVETHSPRMLVQFVSTQYNSADGACFALDRA